MNTEVTFKCPYCKLVNTAEQDFNCEGDSNEIILTCCSVDEDGNDSGCDQPFYLKTTAKISVVARKIDGFKTKKAKP